MRKLAVIKNARLGADDDGNVVLRFDAFVSVGTASTQIVSWDDAYNIMKTVKRDTDLNGKTCWIESDGLGSFAYFKGMSGI